MIRQVLECGSSLPLFFQIVGRWKLFSRFGVLEAKAPEGWRTPKRLWQQRANDSPRLGVR